MTCVAVTREGWGNFYAFDSKEEAHNHALIQYGDAVMDGPEDLLRNYNLLEIGRLLSRLGDERLRLATLRSIHPDLGLSYTQRIKLLRERSREIWDLVLSQAQRPPSDPETIIRLVQADRQSLTESTMDEKTQDTTKKSKAEKAPKEKKEPKPPRYTAQSIVHLLSDADGKQYGPDHNPKRAGSASAERFARYRDGITVGELLDHEAQTKVFADLDYDVSKGFIEIERVG